MTQLKNCQDVLDNHKIDKAKTKKKYLKKLGKLAADLENANYHDDCAIVLLLHDAHKADKLPSVESVFDLLLNNSEWKNL